MNEEFYMTPDPWGYQSNPDDAERKRRILAMLEQIRPIGTALDVAAGEGWITGDLPAELIHAYEMSDLAASRFPPHVRRVKTAERRYDLVCCMGAFYRHYDWESIYNLILDTAGKHVLIAGIRSWLVPMDFGEIVDEDVFPYRHEYEQQVTLYDARAA